MSTLDKEKVYSILVYMNKEVKKKPDTRKSILIEDDKHKEMMAYAKKNGLALVNLIWESFNTYKDGNIQSK